MAQWTIYKKDGTVRQVVWSVGESESAARYVQPTLEYNGTWMGDCYVTLTVRCAVPVSFQIGDYIVYRNEKFVINYDPTVIKKARRATNGEGFVYDSIKFQSLAYELTDVRMLDYVLHDNNIHYSSLPDFSFFCNDIDDLADRLQVNAARYCEENGFLPSEYWVFLTPSLTRSQDRCTTPALKNVATAKHIEIYGINGGNTYLDDEKKDQNVQVSNQSVWDCCKFIKDTFGLNFIVRGRFVIIGAAGLPTSDIFKYGKGNGFYQIERAADSEQQIITKLFAYGNSTNLPTRYYANLAVTCYGNVTAVIVPTLYQLSVPFERKAFLTGSDEGEYNVTIMHNNIVYQAVAYHNMNNDKVDIGMIYRVDPETGQIIEPNPPFAVGDRVYFIGGINKDYWPSMYRDYSNSNLPNNMAVNVLMLPGFPQESLYEWVIRNGGTAEIGDGNSESIGLAEWHNYHAYFSKDPSKPYIVSQNFLEIGIHEATKKWDGSDETDDIYPTIEGSGLDVITSAETIKDNGVFEEGEKIAGFEIVLPNFGEQFKLDELMKESTDTATISMKNGYCGGREFEIAQATQVEGGVWSCKCKRVQDTALDLWFPYSYRMSIGQEAQADEPYQVRAGDNYVLTGIPMTSTYVELAAVRLLEAALEFLSKNDYTRYTYNPKVDEIFMAYQHDKSLVDGNVISYHDTLKEGDIMLFQDADLNIDGSVFIDKLIIKEYGNAQIPTYDVTLRNDKQVGTIQRIQNKIDSLTSGGAGNPSIPAINNLIAAYGKENFLSKKHTDTAAAKINFADGADFGNFVVDSSGASIWKDDDDNWHIEGDYLHARRKFTAKEVQIEDVHHVGGQQLLTAASMTCDFVVDKGGAYRCFFLRQDDDGKEITNNWMTNDQAYVNTFNLANDGETANHFLWRLVTGTSNDGLDLNTYTIDGTEYDASLYHYIDLSKTICADSSDAPLAGDDIVQLGYRGGDSSRESAIIQAGAGEASPYIREYTGITTFTLPTPDIQLKPGDNILTGQVTMTAGSKMPDGTLVDDYVSETLETINSLDTGNENLLRNTGFTGDYESEAVESESEVFSDTVMFSDPLKHWVYSGVTVVTNGNSASGYAVQLDTGAISQTPTNAIEQDKWYCISFKASGNSVTVSCGGYAQVIPLTNNVKRYIVKFVCENGNANTFSMSGNCLLMEIQLTQGRIPNTDWLPSPLDNDKALAYHQNLSYLTNAINEGRTDILGGLILSQMIRVGNYRDNEMNEETGGMSGLYTSNNSPFLWGGGNMQQAFYTIGKYVNNPEYQPTEEEVAQMAKFVVTHGGRAILNDIVLRGYIYALGGYFRGEVHAESGVFKNVHSQNNNFIIDEDGNFECKDAKLRGNIYNPLFEINSSNKHQYLILQPGETVVYDVRLDLTGLNIQIKDNVFTGVVTINPPKTVAFNGARMNILNSSGYKIVINGGDGYTNISELATGDYGVYVCYHANTTNYFWLKIN